MLEKRSKYDGAGAGAGGGGGGGRRAGDGGSPLIYIGMALVYTTIPSSQLRTSTKETPEQ